MLKTFIRNKITSIGGGTIKAMLELYREEGTYLKNISFRSKIQTIRVL